MIIGFPHPPSGGGPGTFQANIEKKLVQRGHAVSYPRDGVKPDVILVVGGTRKLGWLWKCRMRGTKIVHRLDGLNWRHKFRPINLHPFGKAVIANAIIKFIRAHLADHIVYQSEFARQLWYRSDGRTQAPDTIIYNGTDLERFTESHTAREGRPVLLCVEGRIENDPLIRCVLRRVIPKLIDDDVIREVRIYGAVDQETKTMLDEASCVVWGGKVPHEAMPQVYRDADIFLSLEVAPACPNAVIEALSSGLPVAGYNTGSLAEVVGPEAGIVVDDAADFQQFAAPDANSLVAGIGKIAKSIDFFREKARRRAEKQFSLNDMTDQYLEIMR